jgi:hypothetical protein
MDLMKGLPVLVAAFALLAAGCGSSSTSPSTSAPTKPTFTATLSPANEVPPITGPEATGSGTATITFDTTTNASGQITAATVTFVVNVSGFPANTPLNIAHIHTGAAGVAGGVLVNTGLTAGNNTTNAAGAGTFTVAGVAMTADVASAIIANPAGYYFNVHSTLNPGGVARGQLVKVQ